jgi:Protein of unknown function, DUF547
MPIDVRMNRPRYRLLALLALLLIPLCVHAAFDHRHTVWNDLVATNVVWIDAGHGSQVRYAQFESDRGKLRTYLDSLSAVTKEEFEGWTKSQRLAFLTNAYNAFTIEKILTRYPKLKSIRDFGTFIGNPWKDKFFTLLGTPMSLDGIEHDTIRKPGAYDDPRIHFAVNCASIGCPALRNEAYVADRLDAQFDDQTKRFLSDRSRNRYVLESNTLEVSKIFDWYGSDFHGGDRGQTGLPSFFAAYAAEIADTPEARQAIRDGKAKTAFLDYDWALNDVKK